MDTRKDLVSAPQGRVTRLTSARTASLKISIDQLHFLSCLLKHYSRMLIGSRERGRKGRGDGEKLRCERETLIGGSRMWPSWVPNPQPRQAP